MGQSRHNSLVVLTIHKKDILGDKDFNKKVIERFAAINIRRANTLHKQLTPGSAGHRITAHCRYHIKRLPRYLPGSLSAFQIVALIGIICFHFFFRGGLLFLFAERAMST